MIKAKFTRIVVWGHHFSVPSEDQPFKFDKKIVDFPYSLVLIKVLSDLNVNSRLINLSLISMNSDRFTINNKSSTYNSMGDFRMD